MALIWEKIVVTAKEFLEDRNINDSTEFNQPIFRAKITDFDWDFSFCAASIFCEIVWKISIGRGNPEASRELDRLFSPSPVATHANFRGCRRYKTGSLPEKGAIAVWKRGNSWQGNMGIVLDVSEDKEKFDIAEGRILTGSQEFFIRIEEHKGKRLRLPFKQDQLNLIGFIYPPNREIA